MKIEKNDIKKILVLMGPAIGDVLVSTPLLKNLRHSFPNARIDVLNETIYGGGYGILKRNKNVDNIVQFTRDHIHPKLIDKLKSIPGLFYGRSGVLQKLRFINGLRKEKYDVVISCFPSTKKSTLFAFLVGAKIRAGITTNNYSFLFNIKIKPEKKHRIDMEAEIVEKIGGEVVSKKMDLGLDLTKAQKKIDGLIKKDKLKNFVILHPGQFTHRTWMSERWVEVTYFLIEHGFQAVFIGEGLNRVENEKIFSILDEKKIKGKVFNFCDKLSLEETTALIKRARLFVGINTGIMHISSAIGTKTIGLQGISLYGWEAYGKHCVNIREYDYSLCNGPLENSTCDRLCKFGETPCMKAISAQKVIEEIKKVLKIK